MTLKTFEKTWEEFQQRVLDLEKENEHFKLENEMLRQQNKAFQQNKKFSQSVVNKSPLRAAEIVPLKHGREDKSSLHQPQSRNLFLVNHASLRN